MDILDPQDISFTNFILAMSNCSSDAKLSVDSDMCKCDIGVGGWMQTRERIGHANFLPEMRQGSINVVVRSDNTFRSGRGIFFLNVFGKYVWMNIFILFLLFSFIKVLDRRFEPIQPNHPHEDLTAYSGSKISSSESQDGHQSWKERASYYLRNSPFFSSAQRRRLKKAAIETVFDMVGQGQNPSQSEGGYSTRRNVLGIIIALSGIFFVLSWEAAMTASLVTGHVQSVYRNIDDFKNCHIPAEEVCIPNGGAVESFWRNSISRIPCQQNKMPKGIQVEYAEEKVLRGDCKYYVSGVSSYALTTGKNCSQMDIVGDPVFWGGNSFVISKTINQSIVDELGRATLDLREEGLLKSSHDFSDHGCTDKKETSLEWADLKVVFISVYVSCAIILLLMVFVPSSPPRSSTVKSVDVEDGVE